MSKKAVIVLDDDPLILRVISVSLRNWGYQVDAFENVAASPMSRQRHAADCQAERHCYDVLITDNVMPETSGLELLRQRKQAQCKIPRWILISGNLTAKQEAAARALGCEVLFKPFGMDELRRLLEPELA